MQFFSWSFIMKKWILLFFCVISNSFAQASSCPNRFDKFTETAAPLQNNKDFLVQEILDIVHEQIPKEMFTAGYSSIGINTNKGLQRLSRMLKKNIDSYTDERIAQLQEKLTHPDQRSQTAMEEIQKALQKWQSRKRIRIAAGTAAGVILIPPASFYLFWEVVWFLTNALAP